MLSRTLKDFFTFLFFYRCKRYKDFFVCMNNVPNSAIEYNSIEFFKRDFIVFAPPYTITTLSYTLITRLPKNSISK